MKKNLITVVTAAIVSALLLVVPTHAQNADICLDTSESAVVEQDTADTNLIERDSLTATKLAEMIDAKGYYYDAQIADADADIKIVGCDSSHYPERPDYLYVTRLGAKKSLSVLSADEQYTVHIPLRNVSENDLAVDDLRVSATFIMGNGFEKTYLIVDVSYGDSWFTYAEEFGVYNPDGLRLTCKQTGTTADVYNGAVRIGYTEDPFLGSGKYSLTVGYEECDGAFPAGSEYDCKVSFSIRFAEVSATISQPSPTLAPRSDRSTGLATGVTPSLDRSKTGSRSGMCDSEDDRAATTHPSYDDQYAESHPNPRAY